LYPVIDDDHCSECGLCRKLCPLLNKCDIKKQNVEPKCYAAWNKDESIRRESSSGGVFSVLAKHIFKNRGFVCGAYFDDENKLRHGVFSHEKELPKLRGSKYLQSQIGNVFSDIKELLDKVNTVLFVGTPCQVAGLNAFLRKEYENLITVGLVCHGTPSPLVFDRYLKVVENSTGKKIKAISFRDKSSGWKMSSFILWGNDGGQIHQQIMEQDDFCKGFLANLYLRPLCTECPFANIPRHADITLGDFWCIGNYKKDLDDDKGTSLILVNSDKGASIFAAIQQDVFQEEVPLDVAHSGNRVLSMPNERHVNRDAFFKEFSSNSCNVGELISHCLDNSCFWAKNSVGIFTMRLPNHNYGATLQAYALQKSIEKLGYDAKVINYVSDIPVKKEDRLCALGFYKFRERYIKMTPVCRTDDDLINLNKQFDTFVVGSDQVWNYNYLYWTYRNNISKYFLDFAISSKNILSYAPSFAENHWKGTAGEIKQARDALQNFSAVSVREKAGVEICRNVFGINATCVLDPTFLLSQEDYQEIIDADLIDKHEGKYVAFFVLDEKLEESIKTNAGVNEIAGGLNGRLLNVRGFKKKILGEERFVYNTVPAWLSYIKKCEFIITDSYHCVIFAILFRKQFIAVARDYAGNDRLESLLSIFNVKNRFLKSLSEIQSAGILEKSIDYDLVHKALDVEKEKSLRFLADSLQSDIPDKVKIQRLENALISTRLERLHLQVETQTSQANYQGLREKHQALEYQIQALQNQIAEYQGLEAERQALEFKMNLLQNTKAVRYSNKIKKILRKIGFRRFREC
jgi:coenzyme F420-reducing hydrogenase beta subunit